MQQNPAYRRLSYSLPFVRYSSRLIVLLSLPKHRCCFVLEVRCNCLEIYYTCDMRKNAREARPDAMSRSMINIELSPEAQDAVDTACEKSGMKKRELVARVLRWFAGQDDEIRALVLGAIPKSLAPMVTRHLLEALAGIDSAVAHVDTKRKS